MTDETATEEAAPERIALVEADYRDIMQLIDLAVRGHGIALDLAHVKSVAEKVQAVASQEE